jgi:hypothetical protein
MIHERGLKEGLHQVINDSGAEGGDLTPASAGIVHLAHAGLLFPEVFLVAFQALVGGELRKSGRIEFIRSWIGVGFRRHGGSVRGPD